MLVQTSQTGGNAVSDKRVDLLYDDASQMAGTLFGPASFNRTSLLAANIRTTRQAG